MVSHGVMFACAYAKSSFSQKQFHENVHIFASLKHTKCVSKPWKHFSQMFLCLPQNHFYRVLGSFGYASGPVKMLLIVKKCVKMKQEKILEILSGPKNHRNVLGNHY